MYIIGFIDSGSIENNVFGLGGDYIVILFVEGFFIDKYIKYILCLKFDFYFVEILEFFLKVCNVVVVVYWNGIVYWDFKLVNIFVDVYKELWIFDFGIVKIFFGVNFGWGMMINGEFLGLVFWMSFE